MTMHIQKITLRVLENHGITPDHPDWALICAKTEIPENYPFESILDPKPNVSELPESAEWSGFFDGVVTAALIELAIALALFLAYSFYTHPIHWR